MPTSHQGKIAFPIVGQANKSQARTLFVKRMAYVITAASEAQDLVAVDPDTADVVIVIILLGRCYLYDAADTTTAHDGTTCLVTSDGKRYKLAAGSDMVSYAVINVTTTTPPGSPIIGDKYLVATGGTGAWAGHDGQIATFTVRGWEFATLDVGRFLYDKATDSYYHKNSGGTLVLGFGTQTLQANSHPVSALIGRPVRWFIINKTTNTPPGSPSTGDAYIVGSSPTGAWAGHAGKVAICEVGTTFTIYTPRDGELAYDIALKADYRFNSTSSTWESSAGAIISAPEPQYTVSGSMTTGGSGNYSYSDTVAPTSSQAHAEDSVTITHQARKTGARLRFTYQFTANSGANMMAALFRDSEANALDWFEFDQTGSTNTTLVVFEVTTADAASHVYKVRFVNTGSGVASGATRRRFAVEEFA